MSLARRRVLLLFLLAAATAAVFVPALGNRFVDFDDGSYVSKNQHIRHGLTPSFLRWAFTTFHAANWHPLTWISHAVDWSLFGSNPSGHHLTSVALHIAAVMLLFLVLSAQLGGTWPAAMAALLFGIHPLHVESVAWVSERKDVLSGLFFMLSLGAYVRYLRHPGAGRYAVLSIALAMGLMSKPMLVTLPFVLLLLDYWPLGRVGIPGRGRRGEKTWLAVVGEKAPLLLLSAASAAVTYVAQAKGGAVRTWEDFPVHNGAATALVAAAGYLTRTVLPTRLAFFYPVPDGGPPWSLVAVSAVALGLGSVLAAAAFRRRPWWTVGWCWFLGMLVPVIGFPVRVGSQAMADRYTYLPLLGIFVALGVACLGGPVRWPRRRKTAALAGGGVLVAVLGVLAGRQVTVWRDSESLFRQAIAVTQGNWPAHNGLGTILAKRGLIDEAIAHYRTALAIDDRAPRPHFNLGYAMAIRGKWEDALVHYQDALRLDGRYVRAYYRAGIAYQRLGRLDEAEASFRRAWELEPDSVEIVHQLGLVRAGKGDRAGAIEFLGRALSMAPGRLDIRDDYQRAMRGEAVAGPGAGVERGGDDPAD